MGFKCGIVGLPNTGKTTIYNALTKAHAPCAAYPFTTIDANIGIVTVPDPRLDELAKLVPNDKVIYTSVEFVDVAGLVKGASQGEGLGNQFLAKIAEVDAIAHVVRCFECSDVSHVLGSIDPIRDIEIVEHELLLKDIEILDRWLSKNESAAKTGDKKIKAAFGSLKIVLNKLNSDTPARLIDAIDFEAFIELDIRFLTLKPVMYVANIAEFDINKQPSQYIKALDDYAVKTNAPLVNICGKVEEELMQLDVEDQKEFMKELQLEDLSINSLAKAGYELLELITFFTTDSRQLRAWTIPEGMKAQQAAGKIHTDFEKGFIRAEVINFKDFKSCGNEAHAREKGLLRIEGKDYRVCDGDIVHFRFQA